MFALVTGASAGIGLEIARYLAVKGYDLILTARREDRLQKLRRQILEKYPEREVHVIPADLSKREECTRLFEESCRLAGSQNIDFVVNNAGMGVYGRFLETDLEKELTLIDLNVTSVHILSKLFLREMVQNGLRLQELRGPADGGDLRGTAAGAQPCEGLLPVPRTGGYGLQRQRRRAGVRPADHGQAGCAGGRRRRAGWENARHTGHEDEAGDDRIAPSGGASLHDDQLPHTKKESGRVKPSGKRPLGRHKRP